ncbi:AraC family transcriptional regulator [Bosea sp. (in: a-proteobacteria)]|uniref:AraC family transcriptional regulator n=1 Tax=Bosea sp. (in: a-proteobacteria) TaxID=1871050 RepID=UPI002DDCF742|nr:AraC family transcriptional regulator [Bosea sp. (in: a-proteobacteria)]HEV2512628.1 AraC family transcriptional regulator [Bosea sp. (in: a-proteobacteria)]
MLVFFTTEPRWHFALNSDRRTIGIAPAGALEIVPAQNEVFARWTQDKQSMRMDIAPERLRRLAGQEYDRETFELQLPKRGLVDDRARTLVKLLRHEVENTNIATQEAIDALVTVFSTHLLRNYSSLKERQARVFVGGLPSLSWRRVRDFVHDNLMGQLSIEQLASITQLSPSHFMRAFKQTTGQSPHQYVISCRLAYARNLIVNTDAPLSQIAKTVGFSSNSHMTAMMQSNWSTSPSALRKGRSG